MAPSDPLDKASARAFLSILPNDSHSFFLSFSPGAAVTHFIETDIQNAQQGQFAERAVTPFTFYEFIFLQYRERQMDEDQKRLLQSSIKKISMMLNTYAVCALSISMI